MTLNSISMTTYDFLSYNLDGIRYYLKRSNWDKAILQTEFCIEAIDEELDRLIK